MRIFAKERNSAGNSKTDGKDFLILAKLSSGWKVNGEPDVV